MDIERLRALEKRLRDDANGGAGYSTTAYEDGRIAEKLKCADELATLIAELGQEVGAVAVGEVVEGEAAGRAISFPNGYSVTLDALAIGTKIYAGSQPSGGEHMAMHWIDRYAAGIDDEPQIDLIRDALTSPAHTSEARDAARLDWLEKHGCWQFAGPSESDIRGPAYRWFDYDTDGHDYSATLREAIDAAMRQEGGNG